MLPVLDGLKLVGSPPERTAFGVQFLAACRGLGAFYLLHPPIPAGICERALAAGRAFFALPDSDKNAIHLRHSSHFRGYSVMRNERDCREQLHLGPELPTFSGGPDYHRLQGPNLWPAPLGERWRQTMLGYLAAVGALGTQLLASLAVALDLPEGAFADDPPEPAYLLLKLIHYPPHPAEQVRPGVAPHCDWSWLTVLLQDEVAGLEVLGPDGAWLDVPPIEGALVVNLGELMEVATGGCLRATPHRVRNRSGVRPRLSLPAFVNPALGSRVRPLIAPKGAEASLPDTEHIHRVLAPEERPGEFVFGASEWARKGLGRWCHDLACLRRG